MTMRGGIQSRAIKGGGGEKLSKIMLHPFSHQIIKLSIPPSPKNMSASPPTISVLDEEDMHIREHEVVLVRAKHVKEERQRQREEEGRGIGCAVKTT